MKRIAFIIAAVLLFSSCTKVIDIKLDGVDKKYVIEATVTNKAGGCKVLISQTKDVNDNNSFPAISNALVTITDGNGTAITLPETSAGVYEAPAFAGIPGNTYSLQVKIENEVFSSTSTMPEIVGLDNLFVKEEIWLSETIKATNIEYQDPIGIKNYYHFKQFVNGVKREEIYFIDDDYADGNKQLLTLYLFPDTEVEDKIKSGDQVEVQMNCIDKNVFQYWFSAAQSVTSHSQSGSPSNPVSNISGGALGYFSAQTTDKKSVTVN